MKLSSNYHLPGRMSMKYSLYSRCRSPIIIAGGPPSGQVAGIHMVYLKSIAFKHRRNIPVQITTSSNASPKRIDQVLQPLKAFIRCLPMFRENQFPIGFKHPVDLFQYDIHLDNRAEGIGGNHRIKCTVFRRNLICPSLDVRNLKLQLCQVNFSLLP